MALIRTQALILTPTQAADGFVAISWSVIPATYHSILMRCARGLLKYARTQRALQLMTRKRGVFNRVFIFTMDNGRRIVAKLPFVLAGPSMLTTSSEVATIQHRESKPVHPKIGDTNHPGRLSAS